MPDVTVVHTGETTVDVTVNSAAAATLNGQPGAHYLDRSNHTGTQSHATISDFDAGVQTNTLDSLAAPAAAVSMGGQQVTGVADPTGAQDAATKAYVDAEVASGGGGGVIDGGGP